MQSGINFNLRYRQIHDYECKMINSFISLSTISQRSLLFPPQRFFGLRYLILIFEERFLNNVFL